MDEYKKRVSRYLKIDDLIIPDIKNVKNLSEEQQKEFIIKDNVGFGEWDWDILANEWDAKQLIDWGVDLPVFDLPIDDEQPKENDDDKDVCELCGK